MTDRGKCKIKCKQTGPKLTNPNGTPQLLVKLTFNYIIVAATYNDQTVEFSLVISWEVRAFG
jgi:hypothetical protein